MREANPYEPPREDPSHRRYRDDKKPINKLLFARTLIIGSGIYAVLDHVVVATRFGVPPVLFVSGAIAVLFANSERDLWIATATPFAATMFSSFLIGLVESWQYAETGYCAIAGLIASLPAFFVGLLRRTSRSTTFISGVATSRETSTT